VIARGADAYRRIEAESRSPLELVVMLYDGALRFTAEARDAMNRNDVRARAHAISRALAIVAELQNTLNVDKGGAVAEELDRLYVYVTEKLVAATTRRDVASLDEARTVLLTLRDAWGQIAASGGVRP